VARGDPDALDIRDLDIAFDSLSREDIAGKGS
jgi:hypothetical protein